jgi:hypothetical protein
MATQIFFRGATAFFSTTFYDINGNITQPPGATLSILYQNETFNPTTALIPMMGPTGSQTAWTAQWDSSLAGPGTVQWSVSTTGGPPRSVQDGFFVLTANAANLASAP